MGRIQSNVGLITGIPITDTVNQLIQVASQPRDVLTSRTQGLQQQQLAINSLAGRLLSLKSNLGKLKVADPFQARSVTSANEEVLTARPASDGQPPLGSFALRTAQTAGSQQLISQRFETLDDIQSGGSLNFGFGGFVDKGISLDELNDGSGVSRGEIKITDLAGNSAVIDLSLARTVDDVIETINNESTLNVTASAAGDSFALTDNIGGASTLSVQEVNGGRTAADLGLAGISTTDSSATGSDVYGLHNGTKLTKLNDGNGVRLLAGTDDLSIQLRDGEQFGIDLGNSSTLGDVIEAINNDEDNAGRLTASIGPDKNRIVLTDSTGGTGNLIVGNTDDGLGIGNAADDLGLIIDVGADTATGTRLLSGLRDTLVTSLSGGDGIALGSIVIFDRAGDDDTISLASAETLGDIIDAINASSLGVVASTNEAGNGLLLTDPSGGQDSFVIANADATNTADALGITLDATQDSVDSGSLNRQTLSEATLLSSLKGGQGIEASDIRIVDSQGGSPVPINLTVSGNEAKTIGDVIDAINNAAGVSVEARINDTGDGILLIDTAGGEENLQVTDVNGTLAVDLNLTRSSRIDVINDTETQVIDGSSSYSIDLSDLETTSSSISLASLNEGNGIELSDIRITDSSGNVLSLDLNSESLNITTVGELIDTINAEAQRLGVGVTASINTAGTGIELTNTAIGSGNLVVEDINGTTAADLKILSDDSTTKSINGSGLFASQSASEGALAIVAAKINDLESGVTASVLNDGVGFRLQLVVDETGAGNEILIDGSASGFSFEETSAARDALLVVGAGSSPGSGVLVSSSTNAFKQVINGVDLTAVTTSETAVDVTVAKTDADLIDYVEQFVDSYNSLRDELDQLTDFNEDDLSTGLLFGTNEALRVDTELSRIVTDRYFGVGSFQSLEAIGIGIDDSGKLELDKAKLQNAFAEDAQSLQTLFTSADRGIVAKFEATIENLAGADNGLLTNRDNSLQATIDNNQARIERLNESLERQRERLLLQFFQLEEIISGLQTTQQAVSSFQSIAPLAIGN